MSGKFVFYIYMGLAMKKILIMAGMVSLSAVSYAGQKSDAFSYNFVEAQVVGMNDLNLDDNRDDLNLFNDKNNRADLEGLRMKGSFGIAPSFSIIGSLLGASGNHYDLTVLTIGGAYHQPLPEISDMPFGLVVRAEIEHVDPDGANETGILLGGGVQLAILDKLQAFSELSVGSNDYHKYSLSAGARYEFVPTLEATASIEVGDIDILAVGMRYNF